MTAPVYTLETLPEDIRPAHVALGIFDGVHRGHQAVIELAIRAAHTEGTHAAVITFSPHPSRLFHPEDPTLMIMPLETKAEQLKALGLRAMICIKFTQELAGLEGIDFLKLLKDKLPYLNSLYVGENFRFGKGRSGNPDKMAEWGRRLGLHVISVPSVRHDGETISSTHIRAQLASGDLATANAWLGYPYFCEGTVIRGKQLGRTLGFPTLNIAWKPELQPRYGVYVVKVHDASGHTYNGIANYGMRPTVESENVPQLEIHILGDNCPWDAGSHIHIEWLKFIRPEKKFENVEALKTQIAKDIELARKL